MLGAVGRPGGVAGRSGGSRRHRLAFMIRTIAFTAAPWPKPLSWFTVPMK
jgi:hypothetical protein